MRAWTLIGLLLVLAAAGGCGSVYGTWEFRSIEPPSAMRDFGISRLELDDDGDYVADIRVDNMSRTSHGTFTYDRGEKLLVLKPADGGTREYGAEYCGPCKALKVWNNTEPKQWEAKFNKTGKADVEDDDADARDNKQNDGRGQKHDGDYDDRK